MEIKSVNYKLFIFCVGRSFNQVHMTEMILVGGRLRSKNLNNLLGTIYLLNIESIY